MAFGITLTRDSTALAVTLAVYGGPIVVENFLFDVRPPGLSFPPVYDPSKPVTATLKPRFEVSVPSGSGIDPLPPEGCCIGEWTNEPELTGTWTNEGCPG